MFGLDESRRRVAVGRILDAWAKLHSIVAEIDQGLILEATNSLETVKVG